MKLYKNYNLTADANQFVIERIDSIEKINFKTREKTGEIADKSILVGYYGTIEQAIKGCINDLIRNKISNEEFSSLEDIVKEIKEIHKTIDKAVQ